MTQLAVGRIVHERQVVPRGRLSVEYSSVGWNHETRPAGLVDQGKSSSITIQQELSNVIVFAPRSLADFQNHRFAVGFPDWLIPKLYRPVEVSQIQVRCR